MTHANAIAATASSSFASAAVVHCEEGPILPNRDASEIRQEPYSMPNGFHWSNIDMSDATQAQELYTLLSQNYVEDGDELFRFDYSIDFLSWALQPPEFDPNFIFGVRTDGSTAKLVAFISGVPTTIKIHDHTIRVVEINFLCVHKKLRSKRLAPVLIKEITRRVNLTGIFQAVYTAGTVLPVPISSARYYHRNLNPKKLVDVGFSRIGHRMTMARMVKLYKLPETPISVGLRPMIEQDVPSVHILLNQYLSKFSLKILFTLDEIRHWLLPRENVVNTYVICSSSSDQAVTDMISFYHLPSNILRHADTKLYAAYSYYNVATTVPYTQLIKDALILAKHTCHSDVYNALNLMDNNDEIFKELKFGIGDGTLQYYIYNWALATNQTITSNQLGIVLL
jgi:glycylpeptide N-tetradecanoyltransferase